MTHLGEESWKWVLTSENRSKPKFLRALPHAGDECSCFGVTSYGVRTLWLEPQSTGRRITRPSSTSVIPQRKNGLAMKRSRIKPKSAKTKERDEVRGELTRQWLEEAANRSRLGVPECEIKWDRRCTGVATHAHEPKLRSRGGDILDRSECLLTCWHCHSSVHLAVGEELERAYAEGFLKHSWSP